MGASPVCSKLEQAGGRERVGSTAWATVSNPALVYKHTALLRVSSRENQYDKAGSVPSEPLHGVPAQLCYGPRRV